MKVRRLIGIASLLVVAAVVICVALSSYWERAQPTFKNAPKLVAAAQAFSRDQKARGQPLPTSVSLRELVNGGYIATNDFHEFDGMDVTFSLASEMDPQTVLIHVRMSDGTKIGVMGDASIRFLEK